MVKRNPHLDSLSPRYLFQEVAERVNVFRSKTNKNNLISLSVGDTTEPLPRMIVSSFKKAANELGTKKGYRGYGAEAGDFSLRSLIAEEIYQGRVEPHEIFISDGAKCDIGRLQVLFGSQASLAVQDPSYPVYVDTALILGQKPLHFLPCNKENNFLPSIKEIPPVDLIYFCSPHNPTGVAASKQYLSELVTAAAEKNSLILFDGAYAGYIRDSYPRTIFEIDGARKVAIEISSFSKLIGFTGVRLSWTVVPKDLVYENGKSIYEDWRRIVTTFFNGASYLSQKGGFTALKKGLGEIEKMTSFYMENAYLLKEAITSHSIAVYGAENAPYLWLHFPGKKSWDVFQLFLEEMELITTPGSGFGKEGEGFLRVSAFGSRRNILKAVQRIQSKWPKGLL